MPSSFIDSEKLREDVEPNLLIMSRLTESQKAIEELTPEEKEELRDWLDENDPAMEREWAAIAQERIRQIKSGEVARLDGEQPSWSVFNWHFPLLNRPVVRVSGSNGT